MLTLSLPLPVFRSSASLPIPCSPRRPRVAPRRVCWCRRGRALVAHRIGRRQEGELAPHLGEQLLLGLLQLVDLLLGLFVRIAELGQRRRWQRRCRAAGGGVATAGQARLRDRLRLLGRLARARVDEDDLERRLLEDAVEAFRVDEAHTEQHAVHGDRDAEGDLQRRDPGRQGESHAGAVAIGSASSPASWPARSMAISSGPAAPSPSSSSGGAVATPAPAVSLPRREMTEAATSSVSRSTLPRRTRTALPRPSGSAPTARKTSGKASARTMPSLSTVASSSCRPCCARY